MKWYKFILLICIFLIFVGYLILLYGFKISILAVEDKFFHREDNYQFAHIDKNNSNIWNLVFKTDSSAPSIIYRFQSWVNNVLIPPSKNSRVSISVCASLFIERIWYNCKTKKYPLSQCVELKLHDTWVSTNGCNIMDVSTWKREKIYYIVKK